MRVYRIAREPYIRSLSASGRTNRWNPRGVFVLYTSESRSLAQLETLVHLDAVNWPDDLMLAVMELPGNSVQDLDTSELPRDWRKRVLDKRLQRIGADWVASQRSLGLRVPSVVTPGEYNVIINVQHPDAQKIRFVEVMSAQFDPRLKR